VAKIKGSDLFFLLAASGLRALSRVAKDGGRGRTQ
jgi:hypothetical protein